MIKQYFEKNDFDEYLFKRYKIEADENRSIYTRLSILFTIVSLVIFLFSGFLKRLPTLDCIYGYIFVALLGFLLIAILISLFYLILIFVSKYNAFVPNMKKLVSKTNALKTYYNKNGINKTDKEIVDEISDKLRNVYMKCIDHNFKYNRKRYGQLSKSLLFIIFALFLSICITVFYNFIPDSCFDTKIVNVNISNKTLNVKQRRS